MKTIPIPEYLIIQIASLLLAFREDVKDLPNKTIYNDTSEVLSRLEDLYTKN